MANFAILGFGTVGAGVARALRLNSERIAAALGEPLHLQYILSRRDLAGILYGGKAVRDFSILERDRSLDVVVECIGGTGAALEYTRRALLAGKHVVTSNKELVASHGGELLALAREKNVSYLFEASVGGGIPLLRPLTQCLAGDEILEITGVLNGTTNYILTRMVRGGLTLQEALEEAQAEGYAEADPADDVEGTDACRKLCILADLAWGEEVAPERVPTRGIGGLELKDTVIAREAGYCLKLLGRALRLEGGRTAAYVAPHLVPEDCPMAAAEGVYNAVSVRGSAVGDVMFYGQGAGALPTASAVLGDVIDALRRQGPGVPGWSGSAFLADPDELPMRWYLRPGAFLRRTDWQVLSGGAAITAPMTGREARALAERVGAAALLPVLR